MLCPSNNKLTEVLEEANKLFEDGKCSLKKKELNGRSDLSALQNSRLNLHHVTAQTSGSARLLYVVRQ